MKKGKAACPGGIVAEMFMADEDCSVEWLTHLCNLIVAQGRISDDWKSSILLPVFNMKGDLMECGFYRVIKLLEHAMKVIERVFERRVGEKVKIDAMQFGFMPGKGTTDAVFTVRQMQEKYGCKWYKLYFAFVDFEKKHLIEYLDRWALVNAVRTMYEGAHTVVRITERDCKALHQLPVLSLLLFVIVMEIITRELRVGFIWNYCMQLT